MGIRNLLNFVSSIACQKTNITQIPLANTVVAVDVNCFIHKALYTDQSPLMFLQRYVRMLHKQSCQVILVFDGLQYPQKQATNKKRSENRLAQKKKGEELLKNGQVVEALKCFRRCTSISRTMVYEIKSVMQATSGVEVMDAPYEADSQLAYLALNGLADFVITEDSDLVVYGCEKILFKLKLNGECLYYKKEDLDLEGLSWEDFRTLCVLSGCDYLPGGLKGMGIRKGLKMIKSNTIDTVLKDITEEFKEQVRTAIDAFRYQIVYDPVNQVQRTLELIIEEKINVD